MKVLYIASEYFPYNNTGTYRTIKFVKALQKAGITVSVVTLDVEAAKEFIGESKIDPSLEQLTEVIVHRIIPSSLFNYFFSFKSYIKKINKNDYSSFFMKIDELIKAIQPDLIFSTHPHSATIRIAEMISRRSGIPFGIDMRDTWSYWPMASFKTRIHYYLIKREEKRLFKRSNFIITVTPEVKEIFIRSHGENLRGKIQVVYNSYEGELNVPSKIITKSLEDGRPLKIGYIGSFYYDPLIRERRFKNWYSRKGMDKFSYFTGNEDWLYRTPYFFLKSLKLILLEKPEWHNLITVEFIGRKEKWLEAMIDEFGLNDICKLMGFISRGDLKNRYTEFDFLLATSEKVINGRSYCLPSKLFDYIHLGIPIIGFVTNGIQKDFLNNSGISVILDPDNLNESGKKLIRILENSQTMFLNKDYLEQFKLEISSRILLSEFERVFNQK